MGALISLLAGIFGSVGSATAGIGALVTIEGVKWAANKALWMFLVFVAMPLMLYNVLVDLILSMMEFALTHIQSNMGEYSDTLDLTLSVTGMGGWMANQLMLANCLSILMSAVSVKLVLKVIPFSNF